jgi:hypothetical protein
MTLPVLKSALGGLSGVRQVVWSRLANLPHECTEPRFVSYNVSVLHGCNLAVNATSMCGGCKRRNSFFATDPRPTLKRRFASRNHGEAAACCLF